MTTATRVRKARRDGPVSPADVAGELGIDGDAAGKYLRRLTEAGRLGKAGRGLYTPPAEVSECPNGSSAASDIRTLRTGGD